jgi:hypothetical protein
MKRRTEGPIVSDINKKVPTQKEIELRAYEIYLKGGGENGNELQDWLAAEKELTESLQIDASGPTVPDVMPLRNVQPLPELKHAFAIVASSSGCKVRQ